MTTLALLEDALELLRDPNRWCQRRYAQDAKGTSCYPWDSTNAVKWCLVGAIQRRSDEVLRETMQEALSQLQANAGNWCLQEYNDSHTHAEVVALLEQTINRLKG